MFAKNQTINILGTEYKIFVKSYLEDKNFDKLSAYGYCNLVTKEITIVDMKTVPGCENERDEFYERCYKETLRHEIIHAFLTESGLAESSVECIHGWAVNEEMIDWIAIQSPKIYKVFKALDIL